MQMKFDIVKTFRITFTCKCRRSNFFLFFCCANFFDLLFCYYFANFFFCFFRSIRRANLFDFLLLQICLTNLIFSSFFLFAFRDVCYYVKTISICIELRFMKIRAWSLINKFDEMTSFAINKSTFSFFETCIYDKRFSIFHSRYRKMIVRSMIRQKNNSMFWNWQHNACFNIDFSNAKKMNFDEFKKLDVNK